MKLITRDTDYAVRALRFIARNTGSVVTAEALVKALRIPRPFLRKLLQKLNKGGILASYKGKGGGFELAVPADRIYLRDLIGIFQGRLTLNECMFKKAVCPERSTCPLRRELLKIEAYAAERLGSVSIQSLLRGKP